MKLFRTYLKSFLKEDFNLVYYGAVLLFLVLIISVNYGIDLEDGILDEIDAYYWRSGAFMLLYGGLYLSVTLINRLVYGKVPFKSASLFWQNLVFVIFLLSLDIAFHPAGFVNELPGPIRLFTARVLNNLMGIITVLIPFFLYYKTLDRGQPSLYGLTREGFILKPYLKLFLLIIPMVIVGSFLPGFDDQYPMYTSNAAYKYWQLPEWLTVIGYELAYGWNFLSIELLFRGFLVVGMIRVMGRHAIIPMAVVYCSIHFGKPMGECISSIFGGYFLGVIAYYSRNIWGGVFIHVGLAWLMELVSWISKLLTEG